MEEKKKGEECLLDSDTEEEDKEAKSTYFSNIFLILSNMQKVICITFR
jgi:hypothetical protein